MAEEVQSPPALVKPHEQMERVKVRRRKRRRRHRRRALRFFEPSQRLRLVLLIVVFVLLIASLAGTTLRNVGKKIVERVGTVVSVPDVGWEVGLLVVAALILIYLLFAPENDDGLARFFNPQRRTRRR